MAAAKNGQQGPKKSDDRSPVRTGMVWFLVLFAVYMVVGNTLRSFSVIENVLVRPWTAFNATGAAALTRMIGVEVRTEGTVVSYGNGTLNIRDGCNGVEALLILVAAILAFPAPWSRRVVGVLAGTIAIFGANLVRLVNLILVAQYFPNWLEVFHIYIWQALIVLIAFAIFLWWGAFFARAGHVGSPSGSA